MLEKKIENSAKSEFLEDKESYSYQYKFHEISVDSQQLDYIKKIESLEINVRSLESIKIKKLEYLAYQFSINPMGLYDRIQELKEVIFSQIFKRTKELAEGKLTNKQKEIFYLRLKGMTYEDIAALRRRNYTCIINTVEGAKNYTKKGKYKEKYGGYLKKIKRACEKDKEIIRLYEKIKKINNQPLESLYCSEICKNFKQCTLKEEIYNGFFFKMCFLQEN